MSHHLLAVDTLDDRREIWHLLHKLSPMDRVRWLGTVCRKIRERDGHGPHPSVWRMRETITQAYRSDPWNERLTNEIYGDLIMAASQYQLNLLELAVELESVVRRRELM